ncbi:VPLPA-CTERM sorting domain-containing protein [Roseovarius sp. D22-M7]|uniref:VPLPA-CTERM sorting domain-containing protein n=1 Tax=Roseovarius sp. D22-M7 TaxID=3127116 RepID=UPI00300F9A5C
MKTLLSALALGLFALVATDRAAAAPIDFAPANSPVIDVPFATADYLEFGGVGDLSIFFAEGVSTGTPQAGNLFLNILVDFTVTDRTDIAGTLLSSDDNGAFLDGTLVRAGFDADILQLLFGELSGSAASAFGPEALVEIVFIDPFPGNDPLSNLTDGTAYDVAATISAPVPLPAALPLLLAGLGGLVLLRRRG